MPARKPITPGTRFGHWTALEETESRVYPSTPGVIYHLCRCDCGTTRFVRAGFLRSGKSTHCGSSIHRKPRPKKQKMQTIREKHPRIYNIWAGMKARCGNPRLSGYVNYGGRGITVCERWDLFENFLADMGMPPDGCSIDRLDNDGPYCKENCAWKTAREQALNRRNSVYLTFNGLSLHIDEWAHRLGMKTRTLRGRRVANWPVEKILTTPWNMGRKRRT